MINKKRLSAIACSLVLAGCSIAPQYQSEVHVVPSSYELEVVNKSNFILDEVEHVASSFEFTLLNRSDIVDHQAIAFSSDISVDADLSEQEEKILLESSYSIEGSSTALVITVTSYKENGDASTIHVDYELSSLNEVDKVMIGDGDQYNLPVVGTHEGYTNIKLPESSEQPVVIFYSSNLEIRIVKK